MALFAFVFVLAVRQSSTLDPDLWWHLQTGKDIVAAGSIPHVDNYSFTKTGSEWITHEWLSELFMYGIYRLSGLGGLVLVFSTLITTAFVIVYRGAEGKPYLAGLTALLAALSSSPLLGIRPQMITLLMASIYVALLNRFARSGENRVLWWLTPLMLLWVNLHAGFALGLGLIVLYLISLALDRKWDRLRPLAVIGLACTLVIPLNPNGFRIFLYPLQTLTSPSMAALIDEWSSPNFHQAMFLPFAALLLLTFGSLALSPHRVRMGQLFLLLIAAFGALRSSRHIPIFTLMAAPVFAGHLSELMRDRGWNIRDARETRSTPGKLILNLIILLIPVTLAAILLRHFVLNQREYEEQRNPVRAVEFIQARHLPGPIYNRYGWGGYLIHRLYPEYRVYVDGRADVYGDDFLFQMVNTYDGHSGWREPLDRYGVRLVLISPEAGLASLLRSDAGWEKAYEDSQAVVFIRNSASAK